MKKKETDPLPTQEELFQEAVESDNAPDITQELPPDTVQEHQLPPDNPPEELQKEIQENFESITKDDAPALDKPENAEIVTAVPSVSNIVRNLEELRLNVASLAERYRKGGSFRQKMAIEDFEKTLKRLTQLANSL